MKKSTPPSGSTPRPREAEKPKESVATLYGDLLSRQ